MGKNRDSWYSHFLNSTYGIGDPRQEPHIGRRLKGGGGGVAPWPRAGTTSGQGRTASLWDWEPSETLYKGDDALSTKPVMHYQGTADLCY